MGYRVFYSQLIRNARICNNYNDFAPRIGQLVQTLIANGYYKPKLYDTFYKFATEYSALLLKFKLDEKHKIVKFAMAYLK